jgi:hypothetical protein
MKKTTNIFFVNLLMLLCFFTNSFAQLIQTRSYNTGKAFDELPRTDYMGTFSAIYFLQEDKSVQIDNELSLHSVYINDSVIKKRVKKINFSGGLISDSIMVLKLRAQLLDVISYAKKNETIKGYKPDSVFYTAGKNSATQYNLYFVSAGFIKDSVLHKKAKQLALRRNILLGAVNVVSAITIGYIFVPVMGRNTSGPAIPGIDEKKITASAALSGFVIVYDKKSNQVCFFREQFFPRAKDPTVTENITTQIKHAFKENFD